MSKYLSESGLSYLWGKIKSIFATKTELAGHPTGRIYYGTCSTTANTYVKEATVETFPLDANDKPLVGTVIAIKYSVTNTYKTEGQTYALNVNNTGAYPMYYNNAAVATSTSANTLVAGYKNRHVFYVFNGTQWVWLSASYDTNTTYSGMTQAEIDDGTSTTARLITPARLRDNFYTEGEVDDLLDAKADSADIPTVPTNVSAFTNDAGYITGYTESDPTVPAWAKASTKPTYTASEVGALPDDTQLFSGDYNDLTNKPTIPSAVTESTVSGWGFTKNTGTYTKPASGIPASDIASGVIPTVPTALSSFTDDLGSSPTHTHSQYLTSHQDISGKENSSNKVTSLSSSSTDTQYPSAKCVWDLVGDIESLLAAI